MTTFSTLLKLKDSDKFEWREEHRATFTQIKVALVTPPVLIPPRRDKPLKLYISAADESIGCLLVHDTDVITQTDVIQYMLTRPIVKGRIGKWTLALSEFSLQYVPQKAVKGQTLVDFLAQHPSPYGFGGNDVEIGMVGAHDNY
ncbi:uncharacterized protein [Malus domestica]|uniref:uncharacterized protein n=1 Tax=Malus domestica TaxID=3750 RepID=UPI0039754BC7